MSYAIEETTPASGATEYTEDATSSANPSGGQLIARRRDTLAGKTDTDGDHVALNATNKGEAYVKATDSDTILAQIKTSNTIIQTSLSLIDDVVSNTGTPIPVRGLAVSGTDGTNARIIKTDTSGE